MFNLEERILKQLPLGPTSATRESISTARSRSSYNKSSDLILPL